METAVVVALITFAATVIAAVASVVVAMLARKYHHPSTAPVSVPTTAEVVEGIDGVPSPLPVEGEKRRRKVDWHQLLAALQQRVGVGQVTTYGECSQWAFGHRGGGQSIRAMLEAAARRGNQVWTNRVILDDGSVAAAPDHAHGQLAQLQAEGVPFNGEGRADLARTPPVVL